MQPFALSRLSNTSDDVQSPSVDADGLTAKETKQLGLGFQSEVFKFWYNSGA